MANRDLSMRGPFDKGRAATPAEMRRAVVNQMVYGGVIAAVAVLVPVVFIYALYLAGTLLPPESKQAPDPTPDSFLRLQQDALAPEPDARLATFSRA